MTFQVRNSSRDTCVWVFFINLPLQKGMIREVLRVLENLTKHQPSKRNLGMNPSFNPNDLVMKAVDRTDAADAFVLAAFVKS